MTITEIAHELQVEWLETGRVPIGLVTVLAGVGGLGNCQWTCLSRLRCSWSANSLPWRA